MKPSRIRDVLLTIMHDRWPIFIWGPPGVGKSSIVKSIADQLDRRLIDIRATLLDPTDLRGIPAIQGDRSVWLPPSFLPDKDSDPGILFLDEVNASPPLVQASLYQLVLDRKIGEYELPDGWAIIAAGNRAFDRSITFRMPSALANRFVHIEFEQDIVDWRTWATEQNLHPTVVAFLGTRPELLLQESGDAPAYPTPRTWEMTSDVLKTHGGDLSTCKDIIPGIVGPGAAIEFQKYGEIVFREAEFIRIVEEPETADLPSELHQVYALTSWIAYNATDQSVLSGGCKLLARLPPEFSFILARDLLTANPRVVANRDYKAFVKSNMRKISDA